MIWNAVNIELQLSHLNNGRLTSATLRTITFFVLFLLVPCRGHTHFSLFSYKFCLVLAYFYSKILNVQCFKSNIHICGNKMPTRCNRLYLLQILLLAQHVSGTILPIIRSSRVLYRWSLPAVFGALVFKLSVWCGAEGYVSGLQAAPNTAGSNHLYNTLQLLMMGIMVPETCWASNKICSKYHLLHLVGILFPQLFIYYVFMVEKFVWWCIQYQF